mgnify:CR=1 FL=1
MRGPEPDRNSYFFLAGFAFAFFRLEVTLDAVARDATTFTFLAFGFLIPRELVFLTFAIAALPTHAQLRGGGR